jgi:hypothetical protein
MRVRRRQAAAPSSRLRFRPGPVLAAALELFA